MQRMLFLVRMMMTFIGDMFNYCPIYIERERSTNFYFFSFHARFLTSLSMNSLQS
jgi:hypothetical protein